jgi:hypothetical protein
VNISGDHAHIEMVSKDFPDKVYVMLDYKPSRHVQGKNIYRFKPTISDLKDEGFVKIAEEYQSYQERQQKTQIMQADLPYGISEFSKK